MEVTQEGMACQALPQMSCNALQVALDVLRCISLLENKATITVATIVLVAAEQQPPLIKHYGAGAMVSMSQTLGASHQRPMSGY